MQEIRPECKVCELRYQPIGKCPLYMNTIYYFKYQRRMLFFNIHPLLFQNQYFILVNSSNLMDTIKTISVLIELQLNSTVSS